MVVKREKSIGMDVVESIGNAQRKTVESRHADESRDADRFVCLRLYATYVGATFPRSLPAEM